MDCVFHISSPHSKKKSAKTIQWNLIQIHILQRRKNPGRVGSTTSSVSQRFEFLGFEGRIGAGFIEKQGADEIPPKNGEIILMYVRLRIRMIFPVLWMIHKKPNQII